MPKKRIIGAKSTGGFRPGCLAAGSRFRAARMPADCQHFEKTTAGRFPRTAYFS
ncbi:hypothetical protein RB213_011849 [Colletotrichum asianum]